MKKIIYVCIFIFTQTTIIFTCEQNKIKQQYYNNQRLSIYHFLHPEVKTAINTKESDLESLLVKKTYDPFDIINDIVENYETNSNLKHFIKKALYVALESDSKVQASGIFRLKSYTEQDCDYKCQTIAAIEKEILNNKNLNLEEKTLFNQQLKKLTDEIRNEFIYPSY
ncbi:MAG: hypothetical protein ACXWL5_04815 [Candidatus Chromulinivorax sp.]